MTSQACWPTRGCLEVEWDSKKTKPKATRVLIPSYIYSASSQWTYYTNSNFHLIKSDTLYGSANEHLVPGQSRTLQDLCYLTDSNPLQSSTAPITQIRKSVHSNSARMFWSEAQNTSAFTANFVAVNIKDRPLSTTRNTAQCLRVQTPRNLPFRETWVCTCDSPSSQCYAGQMCVCLEWSASWQTQLVTSQMPPNDIHMCGSFRDAHF